jgi:hypothetical protein
MADAAGTPSTSTSEGPIPAITRGERVAKAARPTALGSGGIGDGPDFICVGAQKAGTQWLYDQLTFHPEFWMPPIKELHALDGARDSRLRTAKRFQRRIKRDLGGENATRIADAMRPLDERDVRFVGRYVRDEALFRTGTKGFEAYAELFSEKGDHKSGDVTPAYSKLGEREVKKIATRFPDAKVLFLVREPVERLWSAYGMAARKAAGRTGSSVTPAAVIDFANRRSVASRSYPSETVARWRRHVAEDRFGCFFFDDLRDDPVDLRARIMHFLGADPAQPSGDLAPGFNRKSASAKIALTEDVRAALVRHFADEIRRCADLLGGRAAEWRKKYGI